MKKIVISVLAVVFIAVVAAALYFRSGIEYKRAGERVLEEKYYYNCEQIEDKSALDYLRDVKISYQYEDGIRLVDYPNGYHVDLPKDCTFDLSMSMFTVVAENENYKIDISKERSPYEDVDGYIAHYNNRFITSPEYQKANQIECLEDTTRKIGGQDIRLISLHRTPYPGSEIEKNYYTYAYLKNPNEQQGYYRLLIRCREYDIKEIERILESFTIIKPKGKATYQFTSEPVLPDWNEETAQFYQGFCNRDEVMWGAYTHKLLDDDGMREDIRTLEEKVEFTFPLVMGYTYLSPNPPVKAMQEAYEQGKAVELTLQISTVDNAGLDSSKNPNFEVLDGQKDDVIRQFAQKIRDFGHPILFRLNNEMNTDWTSYSGMVTLCDPDIYKAIHERVFRIFKEEGVQNVIWIFNPQYGDYPPNLWNNYLRYYPGNDQIQVLGITGYNTGNYYEEVSAEVWRSFKDIYDECETLYTENFGNLPWMITEFSCSSYGGNKPNWIRNMFADIKQYKNIKAAVWFSFGDWDFREGRESIVARPYFMDETEETVQAFRDGFDGKVPSSRLPEEEPGE